MNSNKHTQDSRQLHTFFFFFLNDPPPTKTSPLPLHAALPIPTPVAPPQTPSQGTAPLLAQRHLTGTAEDRKSTRLNSSHLVISYAVFCLKKKKNRTTFGVIMIALSEMTPSLNKTSCS